jgi:hypothetical protein
MQPGFSLVDGTLQNNGQYFSLKWQLPFSESLHFFYYFGMRGLFGLSEDLGDGNAISVGAGPRAVQLKTLDPATNLKSVEMRWSVGIFYDRNNSLLTSLFWSDYSDDWLSLNIYPGVLRLGDFSPGAWLVFNRTTGTVIGISTVWFPGVACNWR